ncbi:peptidylprolyl isomerase [Sphingomicrobium nitratireducens]|uniref:peptidylprolyl isomerase n=1 Tax=Sphingomicrobium nitratireducens TaxID=2964666 RepID=UPI00223F061A|nr:peptidylprolyl isomerase [Sphingomicrobium nitratireducens]
MRKLVFGLALGLAAMSAPAVAKDPLPLPKYVSHKAPDEIKADPANHLYLDLSNGGTVEVLLRPDVAPLHVYRIQQLASSGFYNGLSFHRVIPNFMAQGGDPAGNGSGGSSLPDLPAEFNRLPHVRGALAMARAEDENSANSQFYIMFDSVLKLDFDYTVVGRVMGGMDAVDAIAPGEPPAQPTKILAARLGGPLPAAPMVTETVATESDEVAEDSADS